MGILNYRSAGTGIRHCDGLKGSGGVRRVSSSETQGVGVNDLDDRLRILLTSDYDIPTASVECVLARV